MLSTSGRLRKLNYNIMVMTHPSLSPQPGILGNLLGLRGRVVRIYMCQGGKPDTCKFQSSYNIIGMNVCGSAYENGCVVDGMCAMAAD